MVDRTWHLLAYKPYTAYHFMLKALLNSCFKREAHAFDTKHLIGCDFEVCKHSIKMIKKKTLIFAAIIS